MDHFGIGAGVEGAVEVYFQSARRTGRTTSMVNSLKDGDRVLFSNEREAKRVERMFKERGVDVKCLVVDPNALERVKAHGTSQGRTIMDHSLVEQMYSNALRDTRAWVAHFEQSLSGYGEAHRETRRRAEEIAKWRI